MPSLNRNQHLPAVILEEPATLAFINAKQSVKTMFRYDITESKVAAKAVSEVSSRLRSMTEGESETQATLKFVSMKESFDLELLTRFYNEIMIPNFPLEEERDDLEDWIYCLDPASSNQNQNQPYPSMDVLLLIEKDPQSTKDEDTTTSTTTIVVGVAFEYYKQAQCGLLSYMVVPKEFRRLGIMKSLHPVACYAMQLLHNEHTGNSAIRAILAETNTPEAGDVPASVIRKRHEILYQLGYRHLRFPYIQPALAEDAESFDDIILLIYAPDDSSSHDKAAAEKTIATEVLRDYIVDFFQSVTGYDSEKYKEDWFYQLVDWFTRENTLTDIAQGLPWEDITETMKETMAKPTTGSALSESHNDKEISTEKKENRVTVIGAGIAGLVATVTLAEEYLSHQNSSDGYRVPLAITLIEAQPFVGGRIRTVETRDTDTNKAHPLIFNNDRLPPSRTVHGFAPWPVAIGAEFVHGVDSVANQLIEDHEEWLVHETFDLCESAELYPKQNSFVQRRSSITLTEEQRKMPHVEVFMDDNFCPLNANQKVHQSDSSQTSNIRKLIRRANFIWQNLQDISEELSESENEVKYGRDMSLDDFVEDQLSNGGEELTAEEIQKVKKLLESFYSNTAGSSNYDLGIHEASREEWSWEYTESNFRLEKCFNEFIEYYLNRIAEINQESESSNLGIKIDIEMSCPVSEIGSRDKSPDHSPIQVLTRTGKTFVCDKCIVAVPLGVLKGGNLAFRDAYKIPPEIQEAIDAINMFSGMKAHMLLRVGIDIQHISKRMKLTELLFCPGEIFSQVWLRRDEESVFLSGFCVANCRDELMRIVVSRGEMESKSNIAQELMLNQVQRIFGSLNPNQNKIFCDPSSPTCSSFALHDWSDDEFTLGIYSSPSVGAGWGGNKKSLVGGVLPPTYRDILAKPINNEIWFSGEHANTTTCATVQSAMESGARAAKEAFLALEEA